MKEKKNDLWKLDLLEAKYTQATPRFSFTKKLLNARNNSHVMKKLPSTPNEAFQQIAALKADLFRKKYHGSYKKLSRDVARAVKQRQNQKLTGDKNKHIDTFLANHDFLDRLVTAKIVKMVSAAVLVTKQDRENPPTYIPEDVRCYLTDKTLAKNPSRFFITYCQNDNVLNGYISSLWNAKDTKKLCSEIDWSFRKIRGNLTKAELAARASQIGESTKKVSKNSNKDDSESESESDSDSESDNSESDDNENTPGGIDAEEAFDKFATYDNLVAGSDDDDNEFVADPKVNYDEITDEEMSLASSETDSDNSASSLEAKKPILAKDSSSKKPALPQLATGYYSGGSDDEDADNIDDDKVVKEATTTRKNRRGQRARQKIWEQKYGRKANHVQKEHLRIASEREQKQREFEERQRKREMKARLAQEQNTLKTAGSALSESQGEGLKVHPSWEARRLAEEKMTNVKFTGKKITFD